MEGFVGKVIVDALAISALLIFLAWITKKTVVLIKDALGPEGCKVLSKASDKLWSFFI
jgi:hypothetical protein